MIKSTLYITSFIEKMYQLSGKKMIESFLNTDQDGDLLICYEDFNFDSIIENNKDNILTYNLTDDQYLQEWLENNKDIIPIHFGGTASNIVFKNDKLWNVKASRWFRKIASIKYAMEVYGNKYDYLIWVDCDCVFKKKIPISVHNNILNDCAMFYYFGKQREKYDTGYETGFLGFNKENGGYNFINLIIETYDKKFRDIVRWDDGYVIRKVNELYNTNIKTKDIAGNVFNPINCKNPYYNYISHNKGFHAKNKVFKC
jgi:hypothetical protein